MSISKQSNKVLVRTEKRPQRNALLQGIEDFLDTNVTIRYQHDLHVHHFPKRFTVYEPMLLLPPTFASHSPAWKSAYDTLTPAQRTLLFGSIAAAFCKTGHPVTHIAMNAPIAPIVEETVVGNTRDNIMRCPIHLQDLYGDFGPAKLFSSSSTEPSREDFDAAFWVETSQLTGLKQVWAPRWSMFSRGNVREKARILGLAAHNPSPFKGLTETELGEPLDTVDIVDMYVGIGYFALSYLKRGARRVFGWDINAWSIEALRRGCAKNGFRCEVIAIGNTVDGKTVERIADQVCQLLAQQNSVRCIAFLGTNATAGDIMITIAEALEHDTTSLSVRHCNLGLLPSSKDSWQGAIQAMDSSRGGWLHVHENAEIKHVKEMQASIERDIGLQVYQIKDESWETACEHVEMVKTYAPGVGHFVFDFSISPPLSTVAS